MQNLGNSAPLISIIVPIYNSEHTLRKCVDSLLAQTFKQFEVLLIDDGSTDNSAKVCDKYQLVDSRVRVFHQLNGGVSSARQLGIDNAHGKYSIHADPDDWVEPNMLADLYQKAVLENADMVICDFYRDIENKCGYCKQEPSSMDYEVILKEMFTRLNGSMCNKLIRHELYSQYSISFPHEITYGEDLFVVSSLLLTPIKVSYVPQAYYHYVYDKSNNSLSLRYNENIFKQDLHVRKTFDDLLKNNTSAQVLACKRWAMFMGYRAFLGGERFITSKQFKYYFYKDRFYILFCQEPFLRNILVFFACLGFYQPIIKIVNRFFRKTK